MNNPPYFDEISDYIENNITEPDLILKNLYDKYLENKKESTMLNWLYNPKSALEKILDLYTSSPLTTKENIILMLNAYVSYFPQEINKITPAFRSQLKITKASDILVNLVDESLMTKTIMLGEAEGIDPLLAVLPDKGEKIIQTVMEDIKNHRYLTIQSFSQIPETIDALSLPLKYRILMFLIENLDSYGDYKTLAVLSSSLSAIPNLLKLAADKLHTILRFKNLLPSHARAAYCLSQLVKDNILHYSEDSKQIIHDYLTYLKNWQHLTRPERGGLLFSLNHLENLVAICDESIAKEIVSILCHILNSDFVVLDTLANLCHITTAFPEKIINTILDNIIKHISSLGYTDIPNTKKLVCLFEKKPSYIEKILLALINEIIIPDHQLYHKKSLIDLFASWHGMLSNIKNLEIMCLKKLYLHFAENKPSKWMLSFDFGVLIQCFKHLPEEVTPFVNFFIEKLKNEEITDYLYTYVISALGYLQFSFCTIPDEGLHILTWINETLSKNIKNNNLTDSYLQIFFLSRMSNLLEKHPQLIKNIFTNLSLLTAKLVIQESHWSEINLTSESIHLLQKHLNHPSILPEDKKQILSFLENNNIDVNISEENIILLSKYLNKENILLKSFKKELFHNTEDLSHLLIRLISDIPHYSQKLSWVCLLINVMKHYSTENSYYQMRKACSMGALFFYLKRQEWLSEKLPKPLVTCVEEYLDEKKPTVKC